jgi:hypothetical protein
MRILVLDISSSLGWAKLSGTALDDVTIVDKGTLTLGKPILACGFGKYPGNYTNAAYKMAEKVMQLVYADIETPDVIVIEETNLGKSRYNQKFLEFAHYAIVNELSRGLADRIVYLDSSEWRRNLGLVLTKEQKKANATLAKAKREAAAHGQKLDKKKLGIKGKTTKKHVAINWANAKFNLDLKAKDDDIADALCIGCAFLNKATPCDGT